MRIDIGVLSQLTDGTQGWIARFPFVSLTLRTLLLLCLFLLVRSVLAAMGELPPQSYSEPFLLAEVVRSAGWFIALVTLLIAGALAWFGHLLDPWTAMDHGTRLRWFVTFLALLLAWPFTSYGYNFFYDQGHYIDRLLLLALLALTWWRPVFILPFLVLLAAIMGQLTEPIFPGTIMAHKTQVLRVLVLFAAWLLLRSVTGARRTDTFLLLTCCLVASAYWLPALAKLRLDWVMHGHIYRGMLAAYAHGWLGQLAPEQVVSLARFIAWFDWPMRVFVLVIEAGFLLFLCHRKVSIALLGAIVLFHLAVFGLIGYLFWTWIFLDVALLALLWAGIKKREYEIYHARYFALSVVLILAGAYWAKPPQLGWYDTRVAYSFRVDGITDSGRRYRLPPFYFAPYEDIFTMADFSYLVTDHKVLTGPYGVSKNAAVAQALAQPLTADELFKLEESLRGKKPRPERKQRLEHFIAVYVANRNRAAGGFFQGGTHFSPPQFWSHVDYDIFQADAPIREVVVTEVTSLYDDETLAVVRELEVLRVVVPWGD